MVIGHLNHIKASVRHMLSNHAHLITYVTGVWLLKLEVFI